MPWFYSVVHWFDPDIIPCIKTKTGINTCFLKPLFIPLSGALPILIFVMQKLLQVEQHHLKNGHTPKCLNSRDKTIKSLQ
jgi:hypothetical protein